MSHVSHRSTLPPPPDRVGRLTGTAAVSVHATSIAGGTQRDPEGTSREPRRRCYGHRRGISLPKALYQNAARMSRGAEGTTEASGRRDQAGLAARKRRVGAVRGAVPAQNEPKSDRPRAKTPMNRRKSRLRRRAAPIGLGDISPEDQPRSIRPRAQRRAEFLEEGIDPALLNLRQRLPVDAGRATIPLDAPPRLPEDVIPPDPVHQGVEAPFPGPLGRGPKASLQLAHLVERRTPLGGVGSGLAGHALARPCAHAVPTAGALPSGRVLLHGHPQYYGPLGLPLRRSRFHLRLMRAALPRLGLRRRASRVPSHSVSACCAPYPAETSRTCTAGPGRGRRGLRREMSGSALGL